jgi:hypothetical protein
MISPVNGQRIAHMPIAHPNKAKRNEEANESASEKIAEARQSAKNSNVQAGTTNVRGNVSLGKFVDMKM